MQVPEAVAPRGDRLVREPRAEVGGELARGLVAALGLLRERAEHDRDEVGVEPRARSGAAGRARSETMLLQRGVEVARDVVGKAPREELVERDAERVDVAADVDRVDRVPPPARGSPREAIR